MTRGAGQTAFVYDGYFERPQGYSPFDWAYGDAAGWSTEVTDAPLGAGQALKVDYDGSMPVAGAPLTGHALQPGRRI